jgi:glycosyltransferase involved in cell wall biosynthesis
MIALTLDAGPAVHQRAGLNRYAERLAAHLLAEHSAQVNLTLFYNAHSQHQLPASLQHAQVRTVTQGQLGWRLGGLVSQLLRLPIYESQLPPGEIYHATEHLLPYLRRPTVLTVHDLIFARHPAHHTRRNRWFLQVAMPLFVKRADAIIAVSQHTRRDLIELYQTPTDKIHVIYEGIDPAFAPAPPHRIRAVQQQYSPNPQGGVRPYLLMVGTLEPRKNHAAAMRALVRLKTAGFPHRLLIVGGEGWRFAPIAALVEQLGLGADVTFAGYAPATDLPALYSGADCVLQPSLYEGFGFPVLEALACGAPVVCSQVSSLPEVAREAALLVDPTDDEALAAAIRRVLTEPGLRDEMKKKGRMHAAQFRWERCAQETIELYSEVLRLRSKDA